MLAIILFSAIVVLVITLIIIIENASNSRKPHPRPYPRHHIIPGECRHLLGPDYHHCMNRYY